MLTSMGKICPTRNVVQNAFPLTLQYHSFDYDFDEACHRNKGAGGGKVPQLGKISAADDKSVNTNNNIPELNSYTRPCVPHGSSHTIIMYIQEAPGSSRKLQEAPGVVSITLVVSGCLSVLANISAVYSHNRLATLTKQFLPIIAC